MSHIFISYSHKDGNEFLEQIIAHFKANDFGEIIWFDRQGIQSGEDWRDEIDARLRETSVMLVLISPEAMNSHFVTYEWAWAIGSGIRVIPLLFKEVGNISHPLQERKQYIDCRNGIPNDLVGQLKVFSKASSLEFFLGERIANLLMQLRILTRMTIWLYPFIASEIVEVVAFRGFATQAREEARNLYYKVLPEFWFDRASVFTRMQAGIYRDLVDALHILWDKLNSLTDETQYMYMYPKRDYWPLVTNVKDYSLEVIEPLIDILHTKRTDISGFDAYLEAISQGKPPEASLYFFLTLNHLPDSESEAIKNIVKVVIERKTNIS